MLLALAVLLFFELLLFMLALFRSGEDTIIDGFMASFKAI